MADAKGWQVTLIFRALKFYLLFFFFAPQTLLTALPIPDDDALLATFRENLNAKEDHVSRQVRRLGNRTVEVESFISMPGTLREFEKITSDYSSWGQWALDEINTPFPGDSDYLLHLHGLQSPSVDRMVAVFSIELPFFGKQRERTFRLTKRSTKRSFCVSAETILGESSVVKSARAYMKAMAAEATKEPTLWLQVRAQVQFKGAFLYEALPEKVLVREIGDRLQHLTRNFEKVRTTKKTETQIESSPHRKKGSTG